MLCYQERKLRYLLNICVYIHKHMTTRKYIFMTIRIVFSGHMVIASIYNHCLPLVFRNTSVCLGSLLGEVTVLLFLKVLDHLASCFD